MGIASALITSKSSKKAAQVQADAAAAATAESARQYNQTREDYAPYLQAGYGALNKLTAASNGDTSAFTTSPGYEFRLAEGQKAQQNAFASRGGALSGNALKALSDYNQNTASAEYGNWWNQVAGLAGVGQSATNAVTSAGQANSQNTQNNLLSSANARASGIMNSANAINNSMNNTASTFGYFFGKKS